MGEADCEKSQENRGGGGGRGWLGTDGVVKPVSSRYAL